MKTSEERVQFINKTEIYVQLRGIIIMLMFGGGCYVRNAVASICLVENELM